LDEIGRQSWQSVGAVVCPAEFTGYILALYQSNVGETLTDCRYEAG
jgi:hypothetical protein